MKKYRLLSMVVCCSILFSTLISPGAALDLGMGGPAEVLSQSDDQIHYINVNPEHTSDCFLIESNGMYMLVDTSNPDWSTGGAQAVDNDTASVNEAIRYLTSLDYVVLTHNHSDHIGGVTRLCETGFINSSTTVYYRTNASSLEDVICPYWENSIYLRRGLDAMNSAGAEVVCLADANITEMTMQLGDFTIEFLNLDTDQDGVVDFDYENENNNSIVLKVTKGSVDTLLTGDIELEVELALAEQFGEIEVLKVPHHGNKTSSSYEFLKALQPETTILTSEGYWQYGAYEYLRSIGTSIYTTGLCPALAIVEVVLDDSYEIRNGEQYYTYSSDGWNTWLNHSYYVENGRVFRDGWKQISGEWYFFNEDGIMQTGRIVDNGTAYNLSETGAWIPA